MYGLSNVEWTSFDTLYVVSIDPLVDVSNIEASAYGNNVTKTV